MKNIAASIHQRLLNYSRECKLDFNLLLVRYANERLLYRLSISDYKDQFLLKGAMLFTIWFNVPLRPTRDIDLLGFGSNSIADIKEIFVKICEIEDNDGIQFDQETIKGIEIKEGEEYQGVRILLAAYLGKAQVKLQVDVGFGDAVNPQAKLTKVPTVLDQSAPELKVYPKETVLAEKFEAMVKLGISNSRMKDFWDSYKIISELTFDGKILQKAVTETFKRRNTKIPTGTPFALTKDFTSDKAKQQQWKTFLVKNKLDTELELEAVTDLLKKFWNPLMKSVHGEYLLEMYWKPAKWL